MQPLILTTSEVSLSGTFEVVCFFPFFLPLAVYEILFVPHYLSAWMSRYEETIQFFRNKLHQNRKKRPCIQPK